jgi:hypothetical protein
MSAGGSSHSTYLNVVPLQIYEQLKVRVQVGNRDHPRHRHGSTQQDSSTGKSGVGLWGLLARPRCRREAPSNESADAHCRHQQRLQTSFHGWDVDALNKGMRRKKCSLMCHRSVTGILLRLQSHRYVSACCPNNLCAGGSPPRGFSSCYGSETTLINGLCAESVPVFRRCTYMGPIAEDCTQELQYCKWAPHAQPAAVDRACSSRQCQCCAGGPRETCTGCACESNIVAIPQH